MERKEYVALLHFQRGRCDLTWAAFLVMAVLVCGRFGRNSSVPLFISPFFHVFGLFGNVFQSGSLQVQDRRFPTSQGSAAVPAISTLLSTTEISLICSINSKPYYLILHICCVICQHSGMDLV